MGISLRHRIRILARDRYRCAYCGRTSKETRLQVDHIQPRSKGGGHEDANLITACVDCNLGKSNLLIDLPEHVSRPTLPGHRSRSWRPTELWPTGRDMFDAIVEMPNDRFATVTWCTGLLVFAQSTLRDAKWSFRDLSKFVCTHGCINDHELVDLSRPPELSRARELARGRRRADHFATCSDCLANIGSQAVDAALARARQRVAAISLVPA